MTFAKTGTYIPWNKIWGDPIFPTAESRLHLKEPDYSRPRLQVPEESTRIILDKLIILYGQDRARAFYPEIERVMKVHYAHKTMEMIQADQKFQERDRFTERDMVVITYGDQMADWGSRPLKALCNALNIFLHGIVNTIHILPFFPYSSDRGFSILDYREVDPRLGSWDDIEDMSLSFKLMVDGVINHVSAKSDWFQEFLNGNPEYDRFFIHFNTKESVPADYLRLVLRPRTTDLLSPFHTLNGVKYVWTTFSRDQVDLNYKNEQVLSRILQILLFYVRKGADILRLDAATYLWCELGTSCAHLMQTHAIIQLIRAVFDVVAPGVTLLTETNVPHQDNISYFGDGTNEAHMVYNFALPPLVLHTFHTGNCMRLRNWAKELTTPSPYCNYFQFLDSHDGIGLLGARGILDDREIDAMVQKTQAHGGLVSYRTAEDGSKSPYELNITWFDAINKLGYEPVDLQVDRFIASRAVALALSGVPAIYLPSFSGSQLLEPVDVSQLDEPRSINRRKPDPKLAFDLLSDTTSTAYKIMKQFKVLAGQRVRNRAFHPNGTQRILDTGDTVFTVLRTSTDQKVSVVACHNVTAQVQEIQISLDQIGLKNMKWKDLLSDIQFTADGGILKLKLEPYRVLWLQPA